jgi:predicted DNA-binding protein with PD1-like motif
MSVRVHRSERSRHVVFRVSAGELLPSSLTARLIEERVASGWLRASGLLADVELQAFDPQVGALGATRHIAGPVHLLSLESSIGLVHGEPGFSLRAVLARETDRGLETLAGEIVRARTVALEVLVTVLDDVTLERALDETAGIWLIDPAATAVVSVSAPVAPVPAVAPARSVSSIPPRAAAGQPTTAAWSNALEASAHGDREAPAQRPGVSNMQMPQRIVRPPGVDVEGGPVPEPGDVVDHFAFGRCDVVKSDGDRLHLRVHKDGRIREIALEMLRVTPIAADGSGRQFKLERRI